jgi:hypothetical protein
LISQQSNIKKALVDRISLERALSFKRINAAQNIPEKGTKKCSMLMVGSSMSSLKSIAQNKD